MNHSDKTRRERDKWKYESQLGMKKYIIREGLYRRGVPMGVGFGIVYQIVDSGFNFGNYDFLRRLFIGLIVFSIGGLISAFMSWKSKEKKFS